MHACLPSPAIMSPGISDQRGLMHAYYTLARPRSDAHVHEWPLVLIGRVGEQSVRAMARLLGSDAGAEVAGAARRVLQRMRPLLAAAIPGLPVPQVGIQRGEKGRVGGRERRERARA